jgi:hypothetical protein
MMITHHAGTNQFYRRTFRFRSNFKSVFKFSVRQWMGRLAPVLAMLAMAAPAAFAQDTVCASVKIRILQELTLERQAFDAEMKINNTTDSSTIDNVSVVVKVTEENGAPVAVSQDPNNVGAKFFVRVANKQAIDNVEGTGVVNPRTTAIVNWLLIPAPGSAGTSPFGKKYLVGATLKYKFGGEEQTLEVSPAVITVKPLPLLTLDYFLTQDVLGDDPLTPDIEATEPFTLGVRVKNAGFAAAKNLKIDSAQPKIIENNQGLLITFKLTGSYVNDAPAQNTLLINFGDIASGTSKTGRWIMESSLAGKFTEFTAKFSHADELGGSLTSLVKETNAHFLIRDVRVDLPGRDYVRDFLAKDGDVIRVYESDGLDTIVTDRSTAASLVVGANSSGNATYRLTFPATAGFSYVRLPDPFNGLKTLATTVRSDAKQLLPENVWLSKTRNSTTKVWQYWINFFDVNSTGVYDSEFQAPAANARPPVVQFIPDRVVKETKQVSFLVEASSPDGKPITLSATPLPAGARFTPQAADPLVPNVARAIFDWTPARGSAGDYLINYSATDGTLSASRSAKIKVEVDTPPPGPGTPQIASPLTGAQVTSLKPNLSVLTSASAQDPTTKVQFEVYSDEAMSQLVASSLVDKAPAGAGSVAAPTVWQVPSDLNDNTTYYWRARSFDGTLYSAWTNGRFFVNTFNDPPDTFNLTSPAPNAEVSTPQPTLSWTNSSDKDGDTLTYSVTVYKDAALSQTVTSVMDLAQSTEGNTSWVVAAPLTNHSKYYWRVTAKDTLGAQTLTPVRPFTVNTGNAAPTTPVIASPEVGGQSNNPSAALTVQNSTDADNDLISYVFEIDTQNTFDTSDKRSSGQIVQSAGNQSAWTVGNLVENKRYWWRVKAQDGRAESSWVVGNFLMNAVNDAPPAPTVNNPGNGAWSATQQPSLIANPVIDPEGEAVSYQFEVYKDAALTLLATQGTSPNTGWIVPLQLKDKTTHWWRVRALDTQNAASAWSAPSLLYISTAPYQDPTIAVTSPSTPVVPDAVTTPTGVRKQVTIRWEGNDPNIEPTVALYYSTSKTGFAGSLIVDGLRQTSGAQSGNYVWDVSNLAPRAYYIYAVIYDAKGVGRAYAPGAVVIPNAIQAGTVVVTAGNNLRTSEEGRTTAFNIRLGRAPLADVVIPLSTSNSREGIASPASLTFTPQNWAVNQAVSVTGQNDCAPDGNKTYQVFSGKAQSVDPDYIGLSGRAVNVVNQDDFDFPRTTNNASLHICGLSLVSERKVNRNTWEYSLKAELTNTGAAVRGIAASLRQMPFGIELVDANLNFGAVGQDETAKTNDTVILRSRFPIPRELFQLGIGFKWNVVVQP